MSKGPKILKSSLSRINRIDIQPTLINAWLTKNKAALSEMKEKSVTISDCPAPWG